MKNSSIGIMVMALLIGTSAITVNATSYKNCDVNVDGQINVIDVMDVKRAVLNNETVASNSSYATTYNSTSASVPVTTTRTTTTTRVATTKETTNWTTVLEDNTIDSVSEKYKILAKEYIQENAPSMCDYIQDMSVDLYNYDGLVIVTTTEADPTVTTAPSYYTDENGTTYYIATAATAIARYTYDARVKVTFSKNISESDRKAFPNSWLYDDYSNYAEIYFKNGLVYTVK